MTPTKCPQNGECRFSFSFRITLKERVTYVRWDDTDVPWASLDDDGMTEAEDDGDDDDDDDDDFSD